METETGDVNLLCHRGDIVFIIDDENAALVNFSSE
jgi:hypothetical protein